MSPEGHGQHTGGGSQATIGQRKDGSTFPLEMAMGEWSDRGARKLMVVLRDISERREAERRLRESEERFRQIAERIGDVLYVIEVDNSYSYVSPAYEALWGQPVRELHERERAWLDAVHPEDRQRVVEAHEKLRGGVVFDEEYRLVHAGGGVRWVRDRAFPVKDERGGVGRILGVAHDVTRERALAEELHQAQKMEAVGALASGVAHDFNNVLQAILGAATLALSDRTPPERAREYIRRVADAAKRGAKLAAQLLAFSRKQAVDAKPIAIDRAVEGTASLLERLLGEHIRLSVQLRAKGAAIVADDTQIEQILLNLASNARDAMPLGGTFTVRTEDVSLDEGAAERLQLAGAGRYVRLVAGDTGYGMDEATKARIFEPFFTTKRIGKGTGLGLSTVFALTRQLRGHVAVESEKNKGATFTLYFPCVDAAVPEKKVASVAMVGALDGTALVVEDDPLVRMTLVHYLEEFGLEVLEANGPEDAQRVCHVHAGTIDVLVSDVMMPDMTGPQLATRLKKDRSAMQTLFVSAHTKGMLLDQGTMAEDALVLQKPFTREELLAALQGLVRGA
jgi:PAS domain S-box-containing protein